MKYINKKEDIILYTPVYLCGKLKKHKRKSNKTQGVSGYLL